MKKTVVTLVVLILIALVVLLACIYNTAGPRIERVNVPEECQVCGAVITDDPFRISVASGTDFKTYVYDKFVCRDCAYNAYYAIDAILVPVTADE